jgi:two-component system, chemotaxis family, sensor kinase CheA
VDEAQLRQIWPVFSAEAREYTQAIAAGALVLEREADASLVEELQRAAHSLKGAAASLGFGDIERIAHAVEDCLGPASAGTALAPAAVQALLAAARAVDEALERGDAGGRPGVERIPDLLAALGGPGADAAGAPAPEAVASSASSGPPKRTPGERAVRVSAAAVDSVSRHVELLAVGQGRVEPRARRLLAIQAACDEALRAAAGEAEELGVAPAGLERLRELLREIGALGREALHEAARQRVEAAALREDLRDLRMIPATAALEPLRRTAREAAGALGKEVVVALSGTDVKLDRHMVEELRPALVHLVRNAVDHGIEPAAARAAAGKPAAGTVRVEVEPRGSRVAVAVADDGAGVDRDRVRERAVRAGLVEAAAGAALDDAACLELLFRAGFTTADEVTSVSGRGVGLDVVRDVATRLQGTVTVESIVGEGTRFLLDVPLTLATTSGILLRLGGTLAAVPAEAVERVVRLARSDLGTVAGRASACIGEAQIPYAPLGQVLGMPRAAWSAPAAGPQPAIVLALGGERVVFGVDEVMGRQELVVSSLGRICAPVVHLAGAALLEDGSLVGVLNAAELLARARRVVAAGAVEAPTPRIVVADDSPTTRAAMKTILEIAGYTVAPAADGEEALQRLADAPCQLVVSDIQMPRLDGLALTRRIRADPRLRSLPVVLVTSLHSPEDRAAGLEAGADAYLVKGEVESGMLLEMVRRLLPESP